MKRMSSSEYGKFLNEIKSRIVSARIQAVRSVTHELIKLYWDIGKSIVDRQDVLPRIQRQLKTGTACARIALGAQYPYYAKGKKC